MANYGEVENKRVPSALNNSRSNKNFLISSRKKRGLKTKLDVKLIFFRQLSVILQSGVPLSQGLQLLSENITDKKFAGCIEDISSQLSSGKELSNTLR